ncbi:MAG: hypothetical protein JJU13_12460 [Balneolaceae bacterium]|nr:hypothetical protein [Balneolaceae bacterium]
MKTLNYKTDNNTKTFIDSLYLYRSMNGDVFSKAKTYKRQKDPYVCTTLYDPEKQMNFLTLDIKVKGFSKSFLVMRFEKYKSTYKGKRNNNDIYSTKVYIDIHLSNFLYQRFDIRYIPFDTIKNELESVIKHYTFLRIDLDRLYLKQIDIAADIIVDYEYDEYFQLLDTFIFPNKVIHLNQNHHTLSCHNIGTIETIESDHDTPRYFTMYDKTRQMKDVHGTDLDLNIIRVEGKFKVRDKNKKIKLTNGKTGVKKFSDIAFLDTSTVMKTLIFDKFINLYSDLNIEEFTKKRQYKSQSKKYSLIFKSQVDYYQQKEAIDQKREKIKSEIKKDCLVWVKQQRETTTNSIKKVLWEKIVIYLHGKNESSILTNDIENIENTFFNVSINEFIDLYSDDYYGYNKSGEPIIWSISDKVDSYLKSIYKKVFESEINERLKPVRKEIRDIQGNFKKYNKHRFVILAQKKFGDNLNGSDIYRQFRTKCNQLVDSKTSLGFANIYSTYQSNYKSTIDYNNRPTDMNPIELLLIVLGKNENNDSYLNG